MALATLENLKRHLNIPDDDTEDDDELQDHLESAIDIVEGLVGDFVAATITDTLPVHSGTVLLGARPIEPVMVTSSTGAPVVGFQVRKAARLLTGVRAVGNVTVTYPTGDGQVPASVRLATCIIAGHLWDLQRGNGPGSLNLQTDGSVVGPVGLGYAVPSRAKELLARYIGTGQIA